MNASSSEESLASYHSCETIHMDDTNAHAPADEPSNTTAPTASPAHYTPKTQIHTPQDVTPRHRIAIVTRCYYIHNSQWTQSTWGLLDGTRRETINYTFKDYPHNSYKIIINNYNYSTIRAKDQKTFNQGLRCLEEFLIKNCIQEVYAHKTIINELLEYLPLSVASLFTFRPTGNLTQGVYISEHCLQSRNHNSINCSLCIYETIRSDLLQTLNYWTTYTILHTLYYTIYHRHPIHIVPYMCTPLRTHLTLPTAIPYATYSQTLRYLH